MEPPAHAGAPSSDKSLFGLAWPLVIANQLGQLHQVIATFWLGRLAGTIGLAVIALVRPLIAMANRVLAVVPSGAGSEIAREIGARGGRAGAITRNALVAQALIAVPLCLVGIAVAAPLAGLLGGRGSDVAGVLRWYLVPCALALPISSAAEVVLQAVIATGWTRITLWRILGILAIEFVLTPLFMAGLGLGVIGAPLAELCAEVICLALVILLLKRLAGELGLSGWSRGWSLRVEGARRFAAIGAPPEAARIFSFTVIMLLTRLLLTRGESAAAAMALAMQLIYILVQISWSLGGATAIKVGQALGANRLEDAWATVRTALAAGLAVGAMFWLVLPHLGPVVALVDDDPVVVANTLTIFHFARWGILFVGLWQVMAATYIAAGRSGWTGLFMAISDGVGGAVSLLAPDPLQGVGYWFITANALKLVLLASLLRPVLRRSPRARAAG